MKRRDPNFTVELTLETDGSATVDPPRRERAADGHRRRSLLLLGAGLILIGLNLRIGVASVGPVLGDILDDLQLSATTASLLTTIPVFAFGAFAFLTPGLTRRFGMHRALGIIMIVLAAGIALRLQPSLVALLGGTILVGAAIAIGNVLLPTAIKSDFSHRAGLMMGLYSTALFLGAALASGLTVPMLPLFDGSWRWAMGIWAVPAVLAAILFLPQMRRARDSAGPEATDSGRDGSATSASGEPPFRAMLRDPIAWSVTGFMGLQSLSYYAALTWVPAIFQEAGMPADRAGWMLSFSAFPAIITCLVTPTIAKRLKPRWVPVFAAAVLIGAAFLGLLLAPQAGAYAWMTLLGLGQGAAISLSLSYIVWRSPDAHHTGHVSTMAQGFGYLVAGLGPLGLGWLHTVTGSWTVPLIVLIVLLLLQTIIGGLASRDRHVGGRYQGRTVIVMQEPAHTHG
ncbi:MFS transporter, CP family, cyanate transporter [Brevibacterium sp. 239c]|uniref:CynX/NimT family MFS transporter n=1 Tax=Brevibacterium sp. 239c TaxID=1965356 RepID=UPI000C4D1602|nr:MFS transporter [Brevibacterium sp. 239c]SMX90728.1 MFS transporter, CP family, cyanate transporter [Brevibacterium sp. 239c]